MPSSQEHMHCGAVACDLANGARVWDAGMELIRCPVCGVLRIPNENVIHHTVLPDPPGRLPLVMRVLLGMRMLWLCALLPELRDKSVSLVDAGCGDGQFLEFLRYRGYTNAVGIEPDSSRRTNALSRKVRVISDLCELAGDDRTINADVITVWQVLEHISEPAPFVREYAHSLAPSGVLIISVPNQASAQTRLFGYYSAYPDYGRHLWYHDSSYVEWLRSQLPEFEVSVLPDFNFEYEIFSWVDSLLSYAVRRQNFAHRILKKGKGGPFVRALVALAAAVLFLPAVLFSCITLAAGRGSTLTFVVRFPKRGAPETLPAATIRADAR